MPDDPRDLEIKALQRDNARLRGLLDASGATATLRHQVRNSLGMIRSILRQSVDTSRSVQDYAAHLEGRFDSMLRVQNALISSSDAGMDLHKLIGDEFVAYVIEEGGRATLDGPNVKLDPKTTELLGLIFHELTVNAVKFGAMTAAAGHINVAWSVSESDARELDLTWAETGLDGLPPTPDVRGFGLAVVEKMLPYQLGGKSKFDFRPGGVLCNFRIPLKQKLAAPQI